MIARRIRYFFHEWKLVSYYNFEKNELFTNENGMDMVRLLEVIARRDLYMKRRDKTFDFMSIGEEDFKRFPNPLP